MLFAVIHGKVDDDDVMHLEFASIVYSRWLTLGCRILRCFVFLGDPPLNFDVMVAFAL